MKNSFLGSPRLLHGDAHTVLPSLSNMETVAWDSRNETLLVVAVRLAVNDSVFSSAGSSMMDRATSCCTVVGPKIKTKSDTPT